jgi:DnaJ homolog subfamily A member 5
VKEAYDVLSDPNERQWYDDHREQILKGKDMEDLKEEDFDYITTSKLMPYFSMSCYSGFDSKKDDNFYRVYATLFRTLDKEEEMEENVGDEHDFLPDFGDADSTAEEVFKFYSQWKFFSTLKKFSYADKYNPNTAPNRRIKRLIETENKKERQQERKEFNDTVLKLIDTIQKRDPRY